MLQLIIHRISDYFVQADWQALNKKKFGYYMPFLFAVNFLTFKLIKKCQIKN